MRDAPRHFLCASAEAIGFCPHPFRLRTCCTYVAEALCASRPTWIPSIGRRRERTGDQCGRSKGRQRQRPLTSATSVRAPQVIARRSLVMYHCGCSCQFGAESPAVATSSFILVRFSLVSFFVVLCEPRLMVILAKYSGRISAYFGIFRNISEEFRGIAEVEPRKELSESPS